MDSTCTDEQLFRLIQRLEREGLCLTPRALVRIHAIITDCTPDNRTEGTQKQLSEYINERCTRDEYK